MVEPKRTQTVWRWGVAYRISKVTRAQAHARPRAPIHPTHADHARTRMLSQTRAPTHTYVILIAFPLQQWLRERASTLRYTYIACIVTSISSPNG